MIIVIDLKGTVTEGRPVMSGGMMALHEEPVPSFTRQARMATEGLTMFTPDAAVHVPMAELWKLAEQVDARFRAPETKPVRRPGAATRKRASKISRRMPK
jgi:hypothetical protein